MALSGTVGAVASVIRRGRRQGEVTVIPALVLMDVTGTGQGPTFMSQRTPFAFSQAGGGTVQVRWRLFADWTQELEDAISDRGLNRLQPVQTGDVLVLSDIPPGQFVVDQADVYPGDHITIYTSTPMSNA